MVSPQLILMFRLAIYWIGYFDFSFAWLITPLLLTVLRDQWKKERDYRLSAARHASIANEKERIESRIRVVDLPSWVFFPDKVSRVFKNPLGL